jgi:hypothetical protein
MGVDLKSPFAGGIQAITPEGFGPSDHAKAAAICLLRMSALSHDHIDKGLNI